MMLSGVVTSGIGIAQDSLRISSARSSYHVQLRNPQVCSAMEKTEKRLRSALSSGGHFELLLSLVHENDVYSTRNKNLQ